MDGGKLVSVYASRRLSLGNEQRVRVSGSFFVEKKLGGRIYTKVGEAADP